ncbi:unnamed protein product [Rhizoctonia solani]|uniref:Glycoside hydrolase family 23 protein n=1 Tax=Rhizoctonia solani TaxID=456999 RepID=A0A8H2XBX8_9AGAM|nr:Glycoside hydrolase family 23 protein [Rhizoctonia solani]CAE6422022.1 unnamed protein product [Rhizoctonia solani]
MVSFSLGSILSLVVLGTTTVGIAVPLIPRDLETQFYQQKEAGFALDPNCGPIGATLNTTRFAGPNGSQAWLSCGLNTTRGWHPPRFSIKDIISKDLEAASKMPNSPFTRCEQYFPLFYKYSDMFKGTSEGLSVDIGQREELLTDLSTFSSTVPAILIASFANQESGCNAETIGGGDEQGLMQITPDKCGGAPGGNCRDPDFNIRTAIGYFAGELSRHNGSILHTIGAYNGWYEGMTVPAATAAANTSCCRCQQNLDYIHQMCNGWIQGVDAYAANLGSYFNLRVCDQPRPTTSSPAPAPAPTN